MAQTTLIPTSPLNSGKINDNFKTSQKTLLQTQKSVKNIGSILENRIKVRKEIFSNIFEDKRRRELATRREEREDALESRKSVLSGGIGSIVQSASSAGGSFIGRLMRAIGFIVAGWILRRLPTWIGYAKEFIARVEELGRIMRSFVNNVTNFFSSLFNTFGALIGNLKRFDLFDSERNVRNSFGQLTKSIEGLGNDFKDTIDVFTTDLTKEIDGVRVGSYSEEAIPEPGQGFTEDASSQTQTYDSGSSSSGSSSGGGRWKPMLDLISSGEGGYDSVNPGLKRPEILNMTISELVQFQYRSKSRDGGSAAVGRYQFILPEYAAKLSGLPMSAKFTPENQDKMAVAYLEKKRRGKEWLSGKISTRDYIEDLAREWGAFRSYSGYVLPGNSGNIGPEKIEAALNKVKSAPQQTTQPAQRAISTPSTTLTGGEYFKPLPQGSFKGGVGQVFGAGREGRSHLGIDITESNWKPGSDPRIPVVAIRGGIVISDRYNPNPSSYTAGVMIRQDDGYDVRYLHMAPSVKPGDKIQSGQQIGRLIPLNGRSVGMPGNDTHLHLELYKGSQLLDPTSYIRSIESGARPKTQITPTPTPSLAQVTAPPSQQRQQISQQITPERKAQDIVAVVPQSSPQQPAASQGSAPPQQQAQPSMGELLNNFIKQKFLLDLSFL